MTCRNSEERTHILKRFLHLLRLGIGMLPPFFEPNSLLLVRGLVLDGFFGCRFDFLIK